MMEIKHGDVGELVVIAKLLTGYVSVTAKVPDIGEFVEKNGTFHAGFVAYVLAWQRNRDLTPDGVIGAETWAAIAKAAPTVSTAKNRKSAMALAVQMLIGGNLTADGIFGARTKSAVAVWQTAHGLKADGIVGPKTWAALLGAAETPAAPITAYVQPVDYKQGDSRWGKLMYSNHGDKSQTMANSGCGPTAMADVVATLIDQGQQPYHELAELAMQWGDRTTSNGTAWSYFPHVMSHFGFDRMIQSASLDALKACLDAGGYVVCSMGPGYWTKGGHFICAWSYDDQYIYANDPASSTRTKQAISDFMRQRKQFFCFYPPAKAPTLTPATATLKRGTKIVDISKWQPDVDYDALCADTSLIILRAGYRGTGGSLKTDERFKQHAEALKARSVRFGVYFYSIASTEAKAVEEARRCVSIATEYNPLFYAVDLEDESITQAAIRAWAAEARALGVTRLGAYVANHLYKAYGFDAVKGLYDFVWIPSYGRNDGTQAASKKPSYACDLWQFTSCGQVNGINGRVDLNTVTGKSLDWFLGVTE